MGDISYCAATGPTLLRKDLVDPEARVCGNPRTLESRRGTMFAGSSLKQGPFVRVPKSFVIRKGDLPL